MTRFNFIAVIITISIASVFFSLTSSAMAGKSEISLPQGVLNAPQIKQLVLGKTVATMVEGKDRDMAFFFGKEGQLKKVRDGWQKTGTWEVRKDGRLCTLIFWRTKPLIRLAQAVVLPEFIDVPATTRTRGLVSI